VDLRTTPTVTTLHAITTVRPFRLRNIQRQFPTTPHTSKNRLARNAWPASVKICLEVCDRVIGFLLELMPDPGVCSQSCNDASVWSTTRGKLIICYTCLPRSAHPLMYMPAAGITTTTARTKCFWNRRVEAQYRGTGMFISEKNIYYLLTPMRTR
jgi:hypothetical protein